MDALIAGIAKKSRAILEIVGKNEACCSEKMITGFGDVLEDLGNFVLESCNWYGFW